MVYKMILEYIGKDFFGFQRQPNVRTVQGELEEVLKKILRKNITIISSGRTDAGVSATYHVASFDFDKELNCFEIFGSLNRLLPQDLKVKELKKAEKEFIGASFNVERKTYVYRIYFGCTAYPIESAGCYFVYGDLDVKNMRRAAKYVVGTHDFTSFCSVDCEKKTRERTIYFCNLKQNKNIVEIKICGNGFLQHMVRIIAGTLIEVGRGKLTPKEFKEILDAKNRKKAKKTAGAEGLTLVDVKYFKPKT